MITIGNLFYIYKHHKIKVDPTFFSDDPIKKPFLESLYKKSPEDLATWTEINGAYEEPIDPELFREKFLDITLRKAVNDFQFKNLADLNAGKYDALLERFPEIKSKLDHTGAVKKTMVPMDEIETVDSLFDPLFPQWDTVFKGISKEDFIVLIGVGGIGKSTVCKYIVSQAMLNGWSFAFIGAEEDPSYIKKSILGFYKKLTPDQANVYFALNRTEFNNFQKQYSKQLFINNSFELSWNSVEEAFNSPADMVIVDNMQRFLSSMGLEENQTNVAAVSRRLSSMVLKYRKPCILVAQESERPPTPKELEMYPTVTKIGTGSARFSQALRQDASLLLRIYTGIGQTTKKILVDKCRFRNLTSPWAEYSITLSNNATWVSELINDPSKIPDHLLKSIKVNKDGEVGKEDEDLEYDFGQEF